MNDDEVLLVGCGPMAVEYYKVIRAQNYKPLVIGRSEHSAATFRDKTGIEPYIGGLEKYLSSLHRLPRKIVVAVGIESLALVTTTLIYAGARDILLEKPGALYLSELEKLTKQAEENNANVFIAYNRRFFSSVMYAKELIVKDGGVLSFSFEFTEWSHIISQLQKAPGIKSHWVMCNSSHVIDLAFFLCGNPVDWKSWSTGGNIWHPAGSRFCGAGKTDKDALFCYQANWDSPGRWGLEICTKKHRLIFHPLEKLEVLESSSLKSDTVEIDDFFDRNFKPGLFKMVQNYLSGVVEDLCSLKEQESMVRRIYYPIAGYND